jgi:hypothetical protein
MDFDVFVLCLIAAGYVLSLVSLLQDAARLLKFTHPRLRVPDAARQDLKTEANPLAGVPRAAPLPATCGHG